MTGPRVRVYLPLSTADVAGLAGHRGAVAVTIGYAVTPALERAAPGADLEELEHAAYTAAATAAGRAAFGIPVRRVVGAADVDVGAVHDSGDPADPARVALSGEVPVGRFGAFHVDESPGGRDLSWYDVSELAAVSELLGGP